MDDRPFAGAAARNADPILEILQHEFRDSTDVLEIGSGTGQHAVHFAATLDHLQWQTSVPNVRDPILLDVRTANLPVSYDAVYSANTAHIMSIDEVVRMFELVARVLRPDGIFCLYGPFRRFGEFSTESNARFDANLRARDPSMGIRDLEELDAVGATNGLYRQNLYAVPSNNLVAVWRKSSRTP